MQPAMFTAAHRRRRLVTLKIVFSSRVFMRLRKKSRQQRTILEYIFRGQEYRFNDIISNPRLSRSGYVGI